MDRNLCYRDLLRYIMARVVRGWLLHSPGADSSGFTLSLLGHQLGHKLHLLLLEHAHIQKLVCICAPETQHAFTLCGFVSS